MNMQSKKIKILSYLYIVLFIGILFCFSFLKDTPIKKQPTKNFVFKKEKVNNKYGLFLSSVYADLNNDILKMSEIYPDAVKLNNKDFLDKSFFVDVFLLQDENKILKTAEQSLNKNPANFLPYIYISNYYFIKKDYKKAYSYLDKIKISSGSVIVDLLKSWILVAEKKNDEALDLLEKNLDNEIFRKYILLHLASIGNFIGDTKYVDEVYTEVLKYDDLTLLDIENIAAFYFSNKNKKKAISILKEYYEKKPENLSAFMLYNSVKNNQYIPKKISSTNEGMGKALFDLYSLFRNIFDSDYFVIVFFKMINNTVPDFYFFLPVNAEFAKNKKNDRLFFEYIDKINPDNYLYIFAQMSKGIYLLKNNNNDGLSLILSLIDKYPSNPYIYLTLGNYYKTKQDFSNSIKYYNLAIENTKNDNLLKELYFLRGQVFDLNKDISSAQKDFDLSYKLKNTSPEFLNYYGYFLILNNIDVDKGVSILYKITIIAANINPFFLDSYGYGLLKNNDIKRAITVLELAKSLDPKNPVITDHLADAYWKVGRYIEAVNEWNKILYLKNIDLFKEINLDYIKYKIANGL